MPDYQTSLRIARPIADVFRYLSDLTTWPKWMPVESTRPVGAGAVRVGTRAEGIMTEGRSPFAMEVTALEPDKSIAFRTLSGPIDWTGRWDVRAIDAGTTEVTSIGTIHLRGIRRLLEPLMAGEVQRNEAKELARLRDELEGGGAART